LSSFLNLFSVITLWGINDLFNRFVLFITKMGEAAQFKELTGMKYVDQAKWFLNGFWMDGAQQETETIWKTTQKFIELDPKKATGCELDEFWSHKLLESFGETLTVLALRDRLRKIDLDCNGKMALLEYFCSKYNKSVKQVINAPQGDNTEQVQEAAQKLEAVQNALVDLQKQLENQQTALEAQRKAEEEAKTAEETLKKAEVELRAAVDDLHKQEESYQNQIKTLESKINDPNASTVTKSKAKNELAQLKNEDPLPLRKAKITQEAALRKVEKERKIAENATANAAAKTVELEAQKRKVEAAVIETEEKYKEAQDYLEEVKRKGGVSHGAIWWMERELKEAQKYLPKKK